MNLIQQLKTDSSEECNDYNLNLLEITRPEIVN